MFRVGDVQTEVVAPFVSVAQRCQVDGRRRNRARKRGPFLVIAFSSGMDGSRAAPQRVQFGLANGVTASAAVCSNSVRYSAACVSVKTT